MAQLLSFPVQQDKQYNRLDRTNQMEENMRTAREGRETYEITASGLQVDSKWTANEEQHSKHTGSTRQAQSAHIK
jgi:hypothetical protein